MVKPIIAMAICLLLVCATGCQRKESPINTHSDNSASPEVKDTGVTARISRMGETNEFRLEVSYTGKRDMQWWTTASASLYDAQGKPVPRPVNKAGTSWFHWKEDEQESTDDEGLLIISNHFGCFRRDNPLVETLILDAKSLSPGRYRAVPIVDIFQSGKDAHPKMNDTYYRDIIGIKPGKVVDCWFTVQ